MNGFELAITLTSCVALMALVAWGSFKLAKGEQDSQDGYFLAGRNLGGLFIAGSLLLTNLSAEQLIGLNGSAYKYNLSSMAWEVTAAVATVAMALIFLPKYLAGAFTTLPQFLRDRFDGQVQTMTVILFLLGYGLVTIPGVLYAGSIAIIKLFDVPTILGIGQFESLVVTILLVGIIGSAYAVVGGLKAVAVSDTFNGIGLLIVGALVPVLGIILLGEGSLLSGLKTIISEHPEKLNAIGDRDAPTPFGTLFTGMLLANLFYWCTNQYVIQRTLAARNLSEGQKGVLLSGFFKILVPFFMMVPGIIAFHLYGPGLASIDQAYPALIRDVLPIWMMGFFLAVLFGAVFSSFNSLLNSAATMFTLDIYEPMRGKKLDDRSAVRVAMIASVVIAVFSFITAPLLWFAPEGLWQIIRIFTGFYNIPVIAIVLMGLFTKRVPAIGAKVTIVFHVIAYGLAKFAFADIVTIHFLHLYAVLFLIEVGIMLVCAQISPREEEWVFQRREQVDLTPWRFAKPVAFTLLSMVVAAYLLFSNIGLANGELGVSYFGLNTALLAANIIVWIVSIRRVKAKSAA